MCHIHTRRGTGVRNVTSKCLLWPRVQVTMVTLYWWPGGTCHALLIMQQVGHSPQLYLHLTCSVLWSLGRVPCVGQHLGPGLEPVPYVVKSGSRTVCGTAPREQGTLSVPGTICGDVWTGYRVCDSTWRTGRPGLDPVPSVLHHLEDRW